MTAAMFDNYVMEKSQDVICNWNERTTVAVARLRRSGGCAPATHAALEIVNLLSALPELFPCLLTIPLFSQNFLSPFYANINTVDVKFWLWLLECISKHTIGASTTWSGGFTTGSSLGLLSLLCSAPLWLFFFLRLLGPRYHAFVIVSRLQVCLLFPCIKKSGLKLFLCNPKSRTIEYQSFSLMFIRVNQTHVIISVIHSLVYCILPVHSIQKPVFFQSRSLVKRVYPCLYLTLVWACRSSTSCRISVRWFEWL